MESNNQSSSDAKPIAQIQSLVDSLLEAHTAEKAKPGKRFKFLLNDKKMCFVLVNGHCYLKRERDLLILSTIDAPAILGLNPFLLEPETIFSHATTEIRYLHLPLSEVLAHAEKQGLWKSVAYSVMHMGAQLGSHVRLNTATPSYELICNLLQALHDEDIETRMTNPAVKYIQDRTALSRSGIMKTLSDLNTGGYIVIKRGLLIKINHLPLKY